MMEAVSTSETSVYFNVTTRRYIPEESKLHTRRRENLKSHTAVDLHYFMYYTIYGLLARAWKQIMKAEVDITDCNWTSHFLRLS
jgi:hypothetical protein